MASDSVSARNLPGSEDDLSSMRLKITPDKALPVVAAALGAGLVLLRLASYGPSVGPDASNYITAARSLLAGDGLIRLGGSPWVWWPPLYPTMLAGGGLFGFDPYAVAGPLNAVIFGLTVLVAVGGCGAICTPVSCGCGAASRSRWPFRSPDWHPTP